MPAKKISSETKARKMMLRGQATAVIPTIHNNVFSLLKEKKKAAVDLYQFCGMDEKQGTNFWSGSTRIDLSTIVGMANFLGVEVHKLLTPTPTK